MSALILEADCQTSEVAARPRTTEAPALILAMRREATEGHLRYATARIEALGFRANVVHGTDRSLIGISSCSEDPPHPDPLPEGEGMSPLPRGEGQGEGSVSRRRLSPSERHGCSPLDYPLASLLSLPGVETASPAAGPFRLVGRAAQPQGSTVRFGDFDFGAGRVGVIAGPCAVESRDQLLRAAEAVKRAGAVGLRGGAFKPRTNPYSFRGLEEEGLALLVEAREAVGLPICTEVMQVEDVELVAHYADMLQVGARNMQNFQLLEAVGRTRKPVLLKRGMSATPEELLQAAEYIAKEGNKAILLCERGVRTFETFTRNTLSLSVVPHLKGLTHLPVLVDPSHGTGRSDLVPPAMLGAVAMGADGLLVEVHPDPADALCDGDQSLDADRFHEAMANAARVAEAVGRRL